MVQRRVVIVMVSLALALVAAPTISQDSSLSDRDNTELIKSAADMAAKGIVVTSELLGVSKGMQDTLSMIQLLMVVLFGLSFGNFMMLLMLMFRGRGNSSN